MLHSLFVPEMVLLRPVRERPISSGQTSAGQKLVHHSTLTSPHGIIYSTASPCTGASFKTFDLPTLGRTCVAICMDLNPFPAADDDPERFELAEHCIATRARVLILLNAWLRSSYNDDDGAEFENESEDIGTVRYWPIDYNRSMQANQQLRASPTRCL